MRGASSSSTPRCAFATQGYRGTSISGDRRRGRALEEPGLLHYFPSKPALLLETLEFFQRQTRDEAARLAQGARSFAEHLLALAAQHEKDPRFIRLLLVLAAEGIDPDHPAHEWMVRR